MQPKQKRTSTKTGIHRLLDVVCEKRKPATRSKYLQRSNRSTKRPRNARFVGIAFMHRLIRAATTSEETDCPVVAAVLAHARQGGWSVHATEHKVSGMLIDGRLLHSSIDLVMERDGEFALYEIKYTSRPMPSILGFMETTDGLKAVFQICAYGHMFRQTRGLEQAPEVNVLLVSDEYIGHYSCSESDQIDAVRSLGLVV
jgi:hypothetical protein